MLYVKRTILLVILLSTVSIVNVFFSLFYLKDDLCENKGGVLGVLVHHPISSHHHDDNTICSVKYEDGGKNCQRNSDCTGDCIRISNNTEHGKCSPATLYHTVGIYPYDSKQQCPHDERNGSCELELFNKSDTWKDYHYVE
ncbi:MAG: hypothetical protein O2942_03280 [Proteobacteria bacterium]|nr:hypothetical protein [Pseudomonadota bacterium]